MKPLNPKCFVVSSYSGYFIVHFLVTLCLIWLLLYSISPLNERQMGQSPILYWIHSCSLKYFPEDSIFLKESYISGPNLELKANWTLLIRHPTIHQFHISSCLQNWTSQFCILYFSLLLLHLAHLHHHNTFLMTSVSPVYPLLLMFYALKSKPISEIQSWSHPFLLWNLPISSHCLYEESRTMQCF